jgi:hypothetical protein
VDVQSIETAMETATVPAAVSTLDLRTGLQNIWGHVLSLDKCVVRYDVVRDMIDKRNAAL